MKLNLTYNPNEENFIDGGGFGAVHKLKSKMDNKYYAVKIIKGHDSSILRKNFLSEVKIITQE